MRHSLRMSPDRSRVLARTVLILSLVAIAICLAGYFTHASVSVQTGCKTVEGHKLCGDNLRTYNEFRDTVNSAFKP